MKGLRGLKIAFLLLFIWISFELTGCTELPKSSPKSYSGAEQLTTDVTTAPDGTTVAQRNVARRLYEDNLPGATKEFYVFSSLSGQTLLHATIDGKVTSSGKRLSPLTVVADDYNYKELGIPIQVGEQKFVTEELIQDDGTYGASVPYIYFFDQQGNYIQYFFTGGQIIHISSAPLRLRDNPVELTSQQ